MSAVVNMLKPFFRGEVRLFRLSELHAAKDWVTGAERAST
jgi:hypothetical protein